MMGFDELRRAVLIVGMVMSPLAGLAQEAQAEGVKPAEESERVMQEKRPGLKFKRGPTCMCAHGTGEEEIRRAEEERRRAAERQQQQ